MRRLFEFGAPEDILWRAKPHVGTDILRDVIRNADTRIRELGAHPMAALNPATGKHQFSTTLAEHEGYVAQFAANGG